MRRWLLLAAVLLAGPLLLWVLGEPTGTSTHSAEDGYRAEQATEPELRASGMTVAPRDEHDIREAAEARLLARRGEGGGGFLRPLLTEGCFGLSGRVLGADGKPVHLSIVSLVGDRYESAYEYTAEDGRFLIEYSAQFPMRVVATAKGHVPFVGPWGRYAVGEHVDLGVIRLEKGRTIAGRVVDQHGEPRSGVRVEIVPDDDPFPAWWQPAAAAGAHFSAQCEVDADGFFRFAQLRPGRYRVLCLGRPDTMAEGVETARTDLVLTLPRKEKQDVPRWTAKLQMHADDRVFALDPDRPRDRWRNVHVDARGRFGGDAVRDARQGELRERWEDDVLVLQVAGPDPVDVILDDRASGTAPTLVEALRPGEGPRSVRLERSTTLKGRIVGPEDGRLTGTWIEATATLGAYRYSRRGQVDASGRFEIRGLRPGVATLRLATDVAMLTHEGNDVWYVEVPVGGAPVTIHARGLAEVEVVLEVPASFVGAYFEFVAFDLHPTEGGVAERDDIVMEGSPTTLRLWLDTGTRDHLLILRCAEGPAVGPIEVAVPRGSTRITARLEEGAVLQGRVVDASGGGLARAEVFLRRADLPGPLLLEGGGDVDDEESRTPSIETALDGRFTLPIPPRGSWRVVASHRAHAMAGTPPIAGPGTLTIPMAPAYRITGRVLASEGGAEPFNDIVAAWPETGGPAIASVITDDGFFEIDGLPAGTYTVSAHAQYEGGPDAGTGWALQRKVKAGARGLRLELKPGQPAWLELVDAAGTRITNATVLAVGPFRCQRLWPLEDDGRFYVHSLGPGAHRFVFHVPGKDRQQVAVRPGDTVRYVFR